MKNKIIFSESPFQTYKRIKGTRKAEILLYIETNIHTSGPLLPDCSQEYLHMLRDKEKLIETWSGGPNGGMHTSITGLTGRGLSVVYFLRT